MDYNTGINQAFEKLCASSTSKTMPELLKLRIQEYFEHRAKQKIILENMKAVESIQSEINRLNEKHRKYKDLCLSIAKEVTRNIEANSYIGDTAYYENIVRLQQEKLELKMSSKTMEGTKNKICYFAKLKKHEFHEMKLIKEFASRIANNHLENKFMHATTKAYIDSIDEVRANMEDIKLRINSHVTTLSPNIEVITTIDEKSFFDSHSMKQLYSDLTNSKSETEQELKNCRNMIVKHFLSHRESDYGLEEIRLAWQLEDERKQLKHESYGEQTAEKTIIKKHIASLFDSLPEELVSFIIGICFLISLSVAGWDYALGVLIILVIYFAPSMVAIIRKHDSKTSVFVLNLFLGWTFVGWVISLVWAFVAKGNNIANNRR